VSISLLAPAALAALAALLLPLLLHLYRRRQPPRLVDFAALRWLQGPQRPRRRVELRDRRLLATRLLLVALGALLLAQPVLRDQRGGKPWVAVAPGVEVGALGIDDASEWRWLAPGFPPLDQPVDRAQPLASLIRELDATLPPATALSLVVPERIDGLDGAALVLSRAVDWRVVPMEDAPAPPPTAALRVALEIDEGHPGKRYLDAVVAAWRADPRGAGVSVVELDDPASPAADLDALVWLRESQPPPALREWARRGGALLRFDDSPVGADAAVLWRSTLGAASLRLVDGERRLDCAFAPHCLPELHDAAFPTLLRSWLADTPMPPARAFAAQVAPTTAAFDWTLPSRSLDAWLVVLIALLFGLERWLASGRRP
jgi:hypothetical protein